MHTHTHTLLQAPIIRPFKYQRDWYFMRAAPSPFYACRGKVSLPITPELGLRVLEDVATAMGRSDPLAGPPRGCVLAPTPAALRQQRGPIRASTGNEGYRLYSFPAGHEVHLHRLLCFLRHGPPARLAWTAGSAHHAVVMHDCDNARWVRI